MTQEETAPQIHVGKMYVATCQDSQSVGTMRVMLSVSLCGGGEEACPPFDGQEGFENKVRACSRRA